MTWILETASIEALIGEVVPDGTRVTIRFEPDGTAGGSAGCNSFAGSYSAGNDGSLTIEAGGMTQMACEEPLMRVEAASVAALGEVGSFTVTDQGTGLLLEGPRQRWPTSRSSPCRSRAPHGGSTASRSAATPSRQRSPVPTPNSSSRTAA